MTDMARQQEFVQLEAERDRLLAMITYHKRPIFGKSSATRAPTWLIVVAAAILCSLGASIVAGYLAGQVPSDFLFLLVALPPLAYILSREVTVFGSKIPIFAIVTLWGGGPPAGEPQAVQRLADCEARIMKLKQGRQ
jgi:hypothetical protein